MAAAGRLGNVQEDLAALDAEAAGHKAEIRRHRQALQECRDRKARYMAGLKALGIGTPDGGGDPSHGRHPAPQPGDDPGPPAPLQG